MKKRIYLDAAAAYPVRPSARRAFQKALMAEGNPAAPHADGQAAARILEDARTRIAKETGAKPDAVIFTSGATESNALAIVGYVKARIAEGAWPEDLRILYSPTQHASVIGAIEEVRRLGATVLPIPFTEGEIDWGKLALRLHEGVALITLDVICGETGTRFDTRRVRTLINALPLANQPVFHVDATQAPLVENMERTRLGADLITFDAQKIGGIRGIGALIAPRLVVLAPLVPGGGQERGLRSGTPSPALAAAFATALEDAQKEREEFGERATRMKERLQSVIEKEIAHVVVNGGTVTTPTILNLSFLNRDTDYLAALLDEAGFSVSTKSACESDAEGSRVVLALTDDARRAASTLRISLHTGLNDKDLDAFSKALREAVVFLDSGT